MEIEQKVVCAVRDNAAIMVHGLHTANVVSLPCLAYSIQLIIKDEVLSQPPVVQLLNCARSLVGHYHRSNVAFRQLQSQLNLPEHVLIQLKVFEEATREISRQCISDYSHYKYVHLRESFHRTMRTMES